MKARQKKATWVTYLVFFLVLIGIGLVAGVIWRIWEMFSDGLGMVV